MDNTVKEKTLAALQKLAETPYFSQEIDVAVDIAYQCVFQHDGLIAKVESLTAQLAAEKKYSERQSKESLKREIDIQGLYERIAAVQAERDAAVKDLCKNCTTCAHKGKSGLKHPCLNCQGLNFVNWEWRGAHAPSGAEGQETK